MLATLTFMSRAIVFKEKFNWEVAVLLLLYFVVALPYIDHVPIYDGGAYFYGLLQAMQLDFDILNFNIYGHSSCAFFMLTALPQYFFPGSARALNLTMLTYGAVGIAAFWYIVQALFNEVATSTERILAVLVFVFWPFYLSNIFHFSTDFGVLVSFLVFICFLLHRKFLLAALAGLFMCFSKMTGFVLYFVAVACFVLSFENRDLLLIANISRTLKKYKLLYLPIIIYGFYSVLDVAQHDNRKFLLSVYTTADLMRGLFDLNIKGHNLFEYLQMIFILHFQWVISAIFFLGYPLSHCGFFSDKTSNSIQRRKEQVFLLLLFISTLFIVTRIRTFVNARYLFYVFPLLLLLALNVIFNLIKYPLIRKTLLGLLVVVMFVSLFRYIDPVSRELLPNIKFGDHAIPNFNSLSNGLRLRDEMVHNLEYLQIHYLEQEVFSEIKPTSNTLILADEWADFYNPFALDRVTYKRSFAQKNVFPIRFIVPQFVLNNQNTVKEFYYLEIPMFSNKHLPELKKRFNNLSQKEFEHDGYKFMLYKFGGLESIAG